jgi:hypothetical protein
VPYVWIKFLHISSALAFVAIHGASMVVLYVVRKETDRKRVEALMGFSAKTVIPMYVSMGVLLATGIWLGLVTTRWLSETWYWLSLGLLALITGLMWLLARPFGKRILAACEIRPSGVPRRSDEELSTILRSQKTNVITAIGTFGLGLILWMMVLKPSF